MNITCITLTISSRVGKPRNKINFKGLLLQPFVLGVRMKTELVIFDLDGTILDTLDDLTDSVNHLLAESGFPCRTREEIRLFIGNGIRNLLKRSAGDNVTDEQIDRMFSDYIPYYFAHCTDKTVPYDGITELIDLLRTRNIKTAVLSNKKDPVVQKLICHYFPGRFDFSAGEREGVKRKPAPDAVFEVMSALDILPENVVYVGDSEVDFLTGQNAGIRSVCVSWGFRDKKILENQGAEIADTVCQLCSMLID